MNPERVGALLQREYPGVQPKVSAMMAVAPSVPVPSGTLISELETAAQNFGIAPNTIDWATFIPKLIAAISTGNWFGLIPMLIQLGPVVWQFVETLIQFLKKNPISPPPPPGGPGTGGPSVTSA